MEQHRVQSRTEQIVGNTDYMADKVGRQERSVVAYEAPGMSSLV